jgi:hypothetical protein
MSRIYVVETAGADGVCILVDANTKQQAIHHVAKQTVRARVASQHNIVDMILAGAQIHHVAKSQSELPIEGDDLDEMLAEQTKKEDKK